MKDELCLKQDYLDLVRRYENTLKRVARHFYPTEGHQYEVLLNDLASYLWEAFPNIPPHLNEQDERAWVYTMLHNKANNLVRNAQVHYSHIYYRANLPDLADESTENPLVTRLYELVEKLEEKDRQLVMLYLDSTPFKEMSMILGQSEPTLLRRMRKIKATLIQLNKQLD